METEVWYGRGRVDTRAFVLYRDEKIVKYREQSGLGLDIGPEFVVNSEVFEAMFTRPDDWIMVEDFNGYDGRHNPVAYWASWSPSIKTVIFGGDWADIPNLPCSVRPSDKPLRSWVAVHLED